jgi:hypothetical protein
MLLTMRTEAERDRANLQRRLEVLKLPVVPLERQGLVMSADPGQTMPVPEAVGVGPDGTALAVWRFRQDVTRKQVTWHTAGRRRVIDAVDVATDMQVSFVQPLPGGHVLLAASRARAEEANGEVWTGSGELQHRAHLGDAIEDLLTTPSGDVWISYFDEAMGGSGPEGHGLARFNSDLTVEWLSPQDSGLPYISDCYSLNVAGETAYFCPYTDFRILSATKSQVTDWGPSPYSFARLLMRRGPDLALIKGSGPEYDVATMLRISRDDPPRIAPTSTGCVPQRSMPCHRRLKTDPSGSRDLAGSLPASLPGVRASCPFIARKKTRRRHWIPTLGRRAVTSRQAPARAACPAGPPEPARSPAPRTPA